MKKTTLLVLILLAFSTAIAWAGPNDEKKARDSFYSIVQNTLGFSRSDCKDIRNSGYGPQMALALLYIARETGKSVSEILKLRDNMNYSFKEICDEYNVNYEVVAAKYRADVIKYNILFPSDTKSERKKNVTTRPRIKGGK